MRAIVNLMSLCFLLLCGGQHLYANTHKGPITASHTLEKKHSVKVSNQDSGNSIIEDADLDDEFHSSDDLQDGNTGKFLAAKQNVLGNWYLQFSSALIFKVSKKHNTVIASPFSYSNPIYLRLGVLRI